MFDTVFAHGSFDITIMFQMQQTKKLSKILWCEKIFSVCTDLRNSTVSTYEVRYRNVNGLQLNVLGQNWTKSSPKIDLSWNPNHTNKDQIELKWTKKEKVVLMRH